MDALKNIWNFFQYQILGMKWLNDLIGSVLNNTGLTQNIKLKEAIQFFIYDSIKIFVLLSILIFIISYIQSYFPPERTKKILGRFKGLTANTIAALFGTITPFCSCSSIPLFIGFSSAGLPVGVTFSFLISSPLVDLASLVLLMSIFGFKIAILYVLVGLVLAVLGGYVISILKMDKYVVAFAKNTGCVECQTIHGGSEFGENAGSVDIEAPKLTVKERIDYAKEQVLFTIKKVYFYVLIGVGIGAIIHNYIPAEFIQKSIGTDNPFSVIIATVLGIPMYADIFGTLPIAESLYAKGVGLGTILSFMMAVTALSLPSIIMLKKVVATKLLIVFVSIVTIGIILIGYLFNMFQGFIV